VTVVTLYGKPGCCLCDEAREAIEAVRAERRFELREVDVSVDAELNRVYGERIPVVAVDGDEAFELQIDVAALRRRLGTVGS
jgi:glutaredoxin